MENETNNNNQEGTKQSDIGEIDIEDVQEETEDEADIQQKNSKVPKQLQAFQYRKGQSGNIKGRPKGKTLKEYCRDFLMSQTEKERQEFLEGLDKETIWKMAEGNPEMKTDITSKGESIVFQISKEIADKNDITPTTENNS